jgi:hypothetical protein
MKISPARAQEVATYCILSALGGVWVGIMYVLLTHPEWLPVTQMGVTP